MRGSRLLLSLLLLAAPLQAQDQPAIPRRTSIATVLGGVAGSGLGLWGGIVAGQWASDNLGLDCCGDDPGLMAKFVGAIAGSIGGTMVGTSAGSAINRDPRPRPKFLPRLRDAMFGTLAGLAVAAGVSSLTSDNTAPLISFSLVQAIYAGLSNGRW
jgi:hypothetical protein